MPVSHQASTKEWSNFGLVIDVEVHVNRGQGAEGDGRGQGSQRGQLG